jgi:hypothetical protein
MIMLGRADPDPVFKIFFPESENDFEAGFSGFKAGGFLCASPEQEKISLPCIPEPRAHSKLG